MFTKGVLDACLDLSENQVNHRKSKYRTKVGGGLNFRYVRELMFYFKNIRLDVAGSGRNAVLDGLE